jgi:hypothetical protein
MLASGLLIGLALIVFPTLGGAEDALTALQRSGVKGSQRDGVKPAAAKLEGMGAPAFCVAKPMRKLSSTVNRLKISRPCGT